MCVCAFSLFWLLEDLFGLLICGMLSFPISAGIANQRRNTCKAFSIGFGEFVAFFSLFFFSISSLSLKFVGCYCDGGGIFFSRSFFIAQVSHIHREMTSSLFCDFISLL